MKNAFRPAPKAGEEQAVSPEFSVNLRNTEPMLVVKERRKAGRAKEFIGGFATVAVLVAALSMFLLTAGHPVMIAAALAGAVVYIGITTAKNVLSEKLSTILIVVLFAVLVAMLVICRKYIGGGLALLINAVFERAQEAQSYVYDMYPLNSKAESSPFVCMGLATAWVSSMLGFFAALPGEKARPIINTLFFIVSMICFAYLGVIPPWAGTAAVLAAFLFSAGSGHLNSAWPIILLVLLVFGGVIMLDPGESYTVSRANENLRDIFALKTAYIMGSEDDGMQIETDAQDEDWEDIDEEYDEEEEEYGSLYTTLAIIGAVLLVIGCAVFFVLRKIAKKRKKIREGLDSKDPNTAIGAMFPYSVRWLKCCGISVENQPFSELLPSIRSDISGDYAEKYGQMMKMWKEAVYSDHSLTEDNRKEMSDFMKETINMSRKKSGWKEKLKVRFKYAL